MTRIGSLTSLQTGTKMACGFAVALLKKDDDDNFNDAENDDADCDSDSRRMAMQVMDLRLNRDCR